MILNQAVTLNFNMHVENNIIMRSTARILTISSRTAAVCWFPQVWKPSAAPRERMS